MRQRNDLLFEHDIPPSQVQRQNVCGACGQIMVAGDGTAIKLEARKTPNRKQRHQQPKKTQSSDEPTGPVKTITCGRCSRITKTSISAPEPITRRKGISKQTHDKMPSLNSSKPLLTANANSKKRAKNRKAGLQALLSGQQQRQTANPLTLGDFMRK